MEARKTSANTSKMFAGMGDGSGKWNGERDAGSIKLVRWELWVWVCQMQACVMVT